MADSLCVFGIGGRSARNGGGHVETFEKFERVEER